MQDEIKNYGFIYSEEVFSPDRTVKVIYGYSDGEKGPITVEPRIIDAASGRILIDLWRTWSQASVEFPGPSRLLVTVHDAYQRVMICKAEIDLNRRVFMLADTGNDNEPVPLETFRQRLLELREVKV